MLEKIRAAAKRSSFLVFTYTTLRHLWKFNIQRPRETPLGFKLMGPTAMVSGNFELEETALIQECLKGADIFVDVGANVGLYTCLARKQGIRTVAFEPLRQNLDYLYTNLEANGWRDVEVYPIGLSEVPGLTVLYGTGTGASLISGWASSSPLLRRTIPVSTLDVMLADRFPEQRLFIKVDVEGAEYGVVRGAQKLLDRQPAAIWLVEIILADWHPGVNPHFLETFEIFWSHGYESRTADAQRAIITPEIIKSWIAKGRGDIGNGYYLFTKMK